MTRLKPYFPAILWMAVIFALSTPHFSSDFTGGIISRIFELFYHRPGFDQLKVINFVVRKSAHVFIYAVLALLWYRGFSRGTRMSKRKAIMAALVICVLWASSDELHQYLGGVRTGKVSDVVLDSAAAALALYIAGPKMDKENKNAA